ncbi:Gfo/Idh/MocA family protein [Microlunatus sp. Y2014]|uniref:Gfo/Idh/MocA family protein n=1 Tax=Microlunatus sp. Y2014 TaxID=3418488 RepID=UPI003DA6E532
MSGSRQYGVALIGAGWVAREYVRAFDADQRSYVRGIWTRTRERGRQLLASHGIEGRSYASLDELLADDAVDVVVSCTPPETRADHLCAAAQAGKHLVIEKPVALTLPEVRAIRDAVADAGVISTTSFVLRWNPQVVTTKKLIDDGWLGAPVFAECGYWHPVAPRPESHHDWRYGQDSGITAFVSGGCHAVDMLRFLVGEVTEVSAFGAKPRGDQPFAFDPVVVASLRFTNGAVGTVSALLEGDTPYNFPIRVIGTDGSIQDNQLHSATRLPGVDGYVSFPTVSPASGDVAHHPFRTEVSHFLDCVQSGTPSHAGIADTWRSMAVCFAIDESVAAGGRPVTIFEE